MATTPTLSVKDLKDFIKNSYKTAFGKRGAVDFNIYNRYRGKQFKHCSELPEKPPQGFDVACYTQEPHGYEQWFMKAQPTNPKNVKYAGFYVGFYKQTGSNYNNGTCNIHYMHIMYEGTTILGTCFEDFNNPGRTLAPATTPTTNQVLNDFAQAFK